MARHDYYNDPDAPNPTTIVPAASAIIVNDRGEILLHRRSDNDLWALPGGAMEVGESISESIIRETKEETGLDIKPEYITGIYTDPKHVIAFSDGEIRQQFSICFYCSILGGNLSLSEESFEVLFFAPHEIHKLKIHPSIQLRIEHYLEKRERPYFS